MTYLLIPLALVLYSALCWIIYLGMMKIDKHWPKSWPEWLQWPLIASTLVLDVILNIIVGTILFLDLPKELLLTARLQRYVTEPGASWSDLGAKPSWRAKLAKFICKHLLDPYDPKGCHCCSPGERVALRQD